jgi:hypothetical protein
VEWTARYARAAEGWCCARPDVGWRGDDVCGVNTADEELVAKGQVVPWTYIINLNSR